MVEHAQSSAPKHPQGERKPEDRWWRSPTVLATIIAAVAAIRAAISRLTGPQSEPSEVTKIEQPTHGPGSPAVSHTGGNVTIICQGVDPKAL
jgi:hypothetical protein